MTEKTKTLWETDKRAAIKQSKLNYFLEYSLETISGAWGVPLNTLRYHCYRKANPWHKQRVAGQTELFRAAIEGKKGITDNVVGLCLKGLEKFVTRVVVRESEISAKDAKFLSDILANTHRIARLEAGEATDIRRFENLTPEQVKEEVRITLRELQNDDPMLEFLGEEDAVYGQTGHKKSSIN